MEIFNDTPILQRKYCMQSPGLVDIEQKPKSARQKLIFRCFVSTLKLAILTRTLVETRGRNNYLCALSLESIHGSDSILLRRCLNLNAERKLYDFDITTLRTRGHHSICNGCNKCEFAQCRAYLAGRGMLCARVT